MVDLKQRVLTGWTLSRFLYLGLGIAFIINCVITEQWFGVVFGAYFASMGLFAFGCVGGNCFVPNKNDTSAKASAGELSVDFEEVKP